MGQDNSQREMQMAPKRMKRCSVFFIIIRGMQFNLCPEIPFAAIRFANPLPTKKIKMWQQNLLARLWKSRYTQTLLVGMQNGAPLWREACHHLAKLHKRSPSDVAVLPFHKFGWINGSGQWLLMAAKNH